MSGLRPTTRHPTPAARGLRSNAASYLQALDEQALNQELDLYLDGGQLTALCKRRRRLLRHINRLIRDKGTDRALFDLDRYEISPTRPASRERPQANGTKPPSTPSLNHNIWVKTAGVHPHIVVHL